MEDEQNFVPHTEPAPEAAATPAPKQSLAIPIAIIIGFAMIAGAIFYTGNTGAPVDVAGAIDGANQPQETAEREDIRPVDDNDHIRGNPNAPIMIVEYSDFDCPFCKNFHDTMNRIMDEYGTTGKVAWVYRHFPLEQLHPSAPRIAAAAECVAEEAGNDAFWTFSDLVFGERGTNEPTNMARLAEFAVASGATESVFNACLSNGDTQNLVEEDFNDGLAAGARGTPHSFVVVGGQSGVINGAQPYEVVKQIVDNVIEQTEQ